LWKIYPVLIELRGYRGKADRRRARLGLEPIQWESNANYW
jgi:hypothetical protein